METFEIIRHHNITLESSSHELTEFCKKFSPILKKNGYVSIDDNLTIFKCYISPDFPGLKGRSIYDNSLYKYGEFDTILIFTELYYEFLKCCKPGQEYRVINDYVKTLIHGLAHQVCSSMRLKQENDHGKE